MKTPIILFCGFLLSGCNVSMWNCIEVGGEITSESRDVDIIKGVEVNIPASVYISQGVPQEVRITAKRGVIDQIFTQTEEGMLVIDYDTCIKNPDSIKIYITAEQFTKLHINGSGDIYTMYPLKSDNLGLKVNGSGNIHAQVEAGEIVSAINGAGDLTLRGQAKTMKININGSGNVHGFDCMVSDCVIKVNGSGDCEVNVSNALEVKINGSGDVAYTGSPKMNTSINGSGKVKSAGDTNQ